MFLPKNFYLIAFLSVLVLACSKAPEPASAPVKAPPIPVELAPAVMASADGTIKASGLLSAADETRLSFKIGGLVKSISVEAGDLVSKGQLLAELDNTEIGASVAGVQAQLDKARRDYQRAQKLFADDVIPKTQLDDAATALTLAQSAANSVGFNRSYARISAAADGVVLRTFVEAREIVTPGQPILALAGSSANKRVKVALSDRDALRISRGDVARVFLDALPGQTFIGQVENLAGAANPMTGLLEIEVSFVVADAALAARLSSGLVVTVEITPTQTDAKAVLMVPISALLEANQLQASVFVIAADVRASRRLIGIGSMHGLNIEVLSGLNAGENVVVRGGAYLDDGRAVTIVTPIAHTGANIPAQVSAVQPVPGTAP
jgi:membrane fusion protein, multidrug efflux system